MENQEVKKINYQFKILYFIGILSVVAGHCGNGGLNLFYNWFPPYSFHLPLFAFTSGYFFWNNKDKFYKEVFKKKFVSFIVTLYVWNLIYGVILSILHNFGIIFGKEMNFETLFVMPLYHGQQFVLNLGSWFLVPLFMMQIATFPFIKKMSKSNFFLCIVSGLYLILGILGVYLSIHCYNTKWWLFLTRFLVLLPFFMAGMLYRKFEFKDTINNTLYFVIIFFLTLCAIYLNGKVNGYTISWNNDYNNVYMTFIIGFLAIAFWLRISRILVPVLKNSKLVIAIADNTFAIMMHHIMGFFLLNSFWLFLSKYFHFIEGFQVELYKSTIWYRYLPKGITNFNILYLIAGIIFSLFVAKFEIKVKSVFLRKKKYVLFQKLSKPKIES